MNANELQNYFRLSDPNNEFLKKVAYGDANELRELMRK